MTSLILGIRNLLKKNIPILRVPPRKALYAYELGKTFALVSTTVFLLSSLISLSVTLKIFTFLFLLFVTYSGAGSVLLVAGLLIVLLIIPGARAWSDLGTIYIVAFVSGAVLALLYNDAVNLLRWISNIFGWSAQKTVFIHELDEKLPLQVIKSPTETEITSESFNKLKPQKRHYLFTLGNAIPPHPFTILFVANPLIENPSKRSTEQPMPPTPDPIIQNRELFLRAVDDALLSLESNEIVGHPDIWPYIRVLTLFDENLAKTDSQNNSHALLQSFGIEYILDGEIASHILYPKREMMSVLDDLATRLRYAKWQDYRDDIDVIFALSASEKYTRSLAYFSAYDANRAAGVDFNFQHLPGRNDRQTYSVQTPTTFQHEYNAGAPGLAALNVLGARPKTYIHEFAHAMSSMHNGAIVDEYYDDIQTIPQAEAGAAGGQYTATFHVNRQEKMGQPHPPGIPQKFAAYNDVEYLSDLSHPSEQENWIGFFPDRSARSDSCIMDRTWGRYKFDKLVARFMYDRLLAKIHRP